MTYGIYIGVFGGYTLGNLNYTILWPGAIIITHGLVI